MSIPTAHGAALNTVAYGKKVLLLPIARVLSKDLRRGAQQWVAL